MFLNSVVISVIFIAALLAGFNPLLLPGIYLAVKIIFAFSDPFLIGLIPGMNSSKLFLVLFAIFLMLSFIKKRKRFNLGNFKGAAKYIIPYLACLFVVPTLHHLLFHGSIPSSHLKFYFLSSWGVLIGSLITIPSNTDLLWKGVRWGLALVTTLLVYPTIKFFLFYGYSTGITLHRLDPFVDLMRFFQAEVTDFFLVFENSQGNSKGIFIWLSTEACYYFTILAAVTFIYLVVKLGSNRVLSKRWIAVFSLVLFLFGFSLLFNYLALSLAFFIALAAYIFIRFARRHENIPNYKSLIIIFFSLVCMFVGNEWFLTKTSSGITLLERLITPYWQNYRFNRNNDFILNYKDELERRNATSNVTRLILVQAALTNTWLKKPVSGVGFDDKEKLNNMDPAKPIYVSWNSFLLDKLSIWGFITGFVTWLPFLFPFFILIRTRFLKGMAITECCLFMAFFITSFWVAGAGGFGYVTGAIGIQNFMVTLFLRRTEARTC